VYRVIRPAFAAFVFGAPAVLVAVAALCAARGDWFSAALYAVAVASLATLIPRERVLWRQGRGLGRLWRELREVSAANVPLG
jgi:hypothetical protein